MQKELLEQKKIWLFDFDGTLVDSMGMWYEVDKAILARHGVTPPEGFSDALLSMTEQQAAQAFLDHGCRGTVESILQEINDLADHHYATSIALKPGAKVLLDELRARGAQLALVTAATLPRVLPCLERNGLLGYFNLILSSESHGLSKSESEIYRMALNYLHGCAEQAIFLDDNPKALRAAAALGITTVGVYDEHVSAAWDDVQRESDVVLRSYEDIAF